MDVIWVSLRTLFPARPASEPFAKLGPHVTSRGQVKKETGVPFDDKIDSVEK